MALCAAGVSGRRSRLHWQQAQSLAGRWRVCTAARRRYGVSPVSRQVELEELTDFVMAATKRRPIAAVCGIGCDPDPKVTVQAPVRLAGGNGRMNAQAEG